jgi:flavin-dependent thymidylate synthase
MTDPLTVLGTMRGRPIGQVEIPGGREITLYAVRPVVILLASVPDADRLAAMAARQCYSPGSILDLPQPLSPKTTAHLVDRVISAGHTSCVEHNQFVFGIRGISRSCSHQLVRHRAGWSYEQQSQRYVDFATQEFIEIVVPPTILRIPPMLEAFLEPIKAQVRAYFMLRDERVHQEDARYLFSNAFDQAGRLRQRPRIAALPGTPHLQPRAVGDSLAGPPDAGGAAKGGPGDLQVRGTHVHDAGDLLGGAAGGSVPPPRVERRGAAGSYSVDAG